MLFAEELNNLERKKVFTSLVGSHNYNLATENSDKDYKSFYYPVYEDFYFRHQLSLKTVIDNNDYELKDLRLLYSLLVDANLNYLELLYSKEVMDYTDDLFYFKLIDARDTIVALHVDRMYLSIMGSIIQRMKNVNSLTNNYNPKHLYHAMRFYYFINEFYSGNFSNFGDALWLKPNLEIRHDILLIKSGQVSEKDELYQNWKNKLNDFVKNNLIFKKEWDDKYNSMFKELKKEYLIEKEGSIYDKFTFDLVYNQVKLNCKQF